VTAGPDDGLWREHALLEAADQVAGIGTWEWALETVELKV
jgi:hypothetical protein